MSSFFPFQVLRYRRRMSVWPTTVSCIVSVYLVNAAVPSIFGRIYSAVDYSGKVVLHCINSNSAYLSWGGGSHLYSIIVV